MLVHSSKFQRNLIDPKITLCVGALVLYTDGRYFYHDGTCWSPKDGLNTVEWIKLFHEGPPRLEPDNFGIMLGLTDDRRALDDTWNQVKVRECLNSFIAQFHEQYAVWPDGEVLQPLAKSRMLTEKFRGRTKKVTKAVNKHLTPAPEDGMGVYAKPARVKLL